MVISDVNVLVYAFRRGSAYHDECRQWLTTLLEGDEAFGVSELVMSSVVRITTNPRSHTPPETLDDAFTFANAVLQDDKALRLTPGLRHWEIFERLCRKSHIKANRVSDAYLAALAIEHGCELITTDGDFARFKGLRWRRPF